MNIDLLEEAIKAVLNENTYILEMWLRNTPGAWGTLAGKTIIAYRILLRRSLTESERRMAWSRLWTHLQTYKSSNSL